MNFRPIPGLLESFGACRDEALAAKIIENTIGDLLLHEQRQVHAQGMKGWVGIKEAPC